MSNDNPFADLPGMPKTLREAIIFFADEDIAHAFMVAIHWPEGVECFHCGSPNVTLLSTRRVFKCRTKGCRKQFTAKRGTIFEDSPIPFGKWFAAVWLIANCKNGISSYEIARGLGVCQKTAWFMLHRIRLAMKYNTIELKKLSGIVEADETLIGGLFKNMHKSKKARIRAESEAEGASTMRAFIGKTIVQAVLERGGEIRAHVVPSTQIDERLPFMEENVVDGSALMTDSGYTNAKFDEHFVHEFVNHEVEYVRGNVHCNGVENFWSLLQRALGGTYVSVEPFHLSKYVDEEAFRFNNRKTDDADRFVKTRSQVTGRRLTYADLTRNPSVN